MALNALAEASPILSQKLLLSIAEEMKMPLIRIARANEIDLAFNIDNRNEKQVIQTASEAAIKLLDNYILGVKMTLEPKLINYESISVSSILFDAKRALDNLAKINGIDLELNISQGIQPVITNKHALEAALVSLGTSLIECMSANDQVKLQFAAHRSRYGIVAGVYAQTKQVSDSALKAGKKLHHTSRQPFINLAYSNGAGIFLADAILRSMNLNLIASRHHKLYGIGAVLTPINQMQLV